MVYSTIKTTLYGDDYPLQYVKEISQIILKNNSIKLIGPEVIPVDNLAKYGNPWDLFFDDEEQKVFISMSGNICHFFRDFVSLFLYAYNKYPNALYVIDLANTVESDKMFVDEFINRITHLGIKFKTIRIEHGTNIYAKNFIYCKNYDYRASYTKEINDFLSYLIENPDPVPTKKIYVSRSLFNKNKKFSDINYKPGASFSNGIRIIDEDILENYLKSKGFEIVSPESFTNFKDQFNTFYNAKTIISVSGAGLTTQLFMRPGGNVIELLKSVMVMGLKEKEYFNFEEELHLFYIEMAWNKGHNYIAIPNKTRKSKDIIEALENSQILKI